MLQIRCDVLHILRACLDSGGFEGTKGIESKMNCSLPSWLPSSKQGLRGQTYRVKKRYSTSQVQRALGKNDGQRQGDVQHPGQVSTDVRRRQQARPRAIEGERPLQEAPEQVARHVHEQLPEQPLGVYLTATIMPIV